MTGLLDLSTEILLIIIDYTLPQKDIYIEQGPFQTWAHRGHAMLLDKSAKGNPYTKHVYDLILSCRRLHNLLKPMLYRDVVATDRLFGKDSSFEVLQRSLGDDRGLEQHVVSAMIHSKGRPIAEMASFFWLPNIENLTIDGFMDWDAPEEQDFAAGTSPVRNLRLLNCGAHESALAMVLSWPFKLEELHYDANQAEWMGHYEGGEEQDWTAEAFVRCLQPHKQTLRTLTLTRPFQDHEGLGTGPGIDLRDFKELRTLHIFDVFLCCWNSEVWRRLPPNLQQLEVFYDDSELTRFVSDEDQQAPFLLNLAPNIERQLPHLRKLHIWSEEKFYDPATGEPQQWHLPPALRRQFDHANLELLVSIEYQFPDFEGWT
jgi:hypothetical protein